MKFFEDCTLSVRMKTLKGDLGRYRRRLYELLGSDRYLHPAARQMDRELERYLSHLNGFFIEAGANDGFTQSNTYYFEKVLHWKGILIEPVPELYRECVKERPNSIIFNCALVPFDYDRPQVTMLYSNLMSLVKGARKSAMADLEHVVSGVQVQKDAEIYELNVPARTLTSILDEVGVKEIDLLSLDVEGYELSVLQGLDFEKYRPQYMLIEANFRDGIEAYISRYYDIADEFSDLDILYRCKYEE